MEVYIKLNGKEQIKMTQISDNTFEADGHLVFVEQSPQQAPPREGDGEDAMGEPNWDQCNCRWDLGMGPDLNCPVHGTKASEPSTSGRGK